MGCFYCGFDVTIMIAVLQVLYLWVSLAKSSVVRSGAEDGIMNIW